MTQRHPVTVEPSSSYLVLLVLVYHPLSLSLFSIFLFRRSYLSRSRQRELYRPKAFIRPHWGSKVGRTRTLDFNYRVRRGSYRRSGTGVAGLVWKRTEVRPCYLFRAYFTTRALLFSKGARFSVWRDGAFECSCKRRNRLLYVSAQTTLRWRVEPFNGNSNTRSARIIRHATCRTAAERT